MTEASARRPLKSRATSWAQGLARRLIKLGATPNAVSVASLVFALLGAACILGTGCCPQGIWLWLTAAVMIQLRLLCNLMDGMLAIEGGLGTADGDIYNETPDRLADVALLAAAGYACTHDYGERLGWLAACGALLTAYVRMHGATLTNDHDFRGPLAKPQRMAVLTGLCLLRPLAGWYGWHGPLHFWTLLALAAGIWLTVIRRIFHLSRTLRNKT